MRRAGRTGRGRASGSSPEFGRSRRQSAGLQDAPGPSVDGPARIFQTKVSYAPLMMWPMGRRRDEYVYAVPGEVWDSDRAEIIANAKELAASKGKRADGEPEVHVLLVWPQVVPTFRSARTSIAN